jgi:hypothetical protein
MCNGIMANLDSYFDTIGHINRTRSCNRNNPAICFLSIRLEAVADALFDSLRGDKR